MGLVLYMMYRPKRRPTRLKLSQERGMSKSNSHSSGAEPRDLSVVFQFNGHSFEAYEVLGLPAGSARPDVDKAYKQAIAENEPESIEFINLAYKSILQTLV